MSLRAGQLNAPAFELSQLGRGRLEVPTLHIEVLAISRHRQRRGHGGRLLETAVQIGLRLSAEIGLKTVSLEATAQSVPFYRQQGLTASETPWPGGSWPMLGGPRLMTWLPPETAA